MCITQIELLLMTKIFCTTDSFALCSIKRVSEFDLILSQSCPLILTKQSKREGNDQETIQSDTTSEPGHHIGKLQKTQEKITYKWSVLSQQVITRLQGTDKTR